MSDIKGYRQLSQEEINLINEVKAMGEQVKALIKKAEDLEADDRWKSIATTNLQQGFMALNRSIAKPSTFA